MESWLGLKQVDPPDADRFDAHFPLQNRGKTRVGAWGPLTGLTSAFEIDGNSKNAAGWRTRLARAD